MSIHICSDRVFLSFTSYYESLVIIIMGKNSSVKIFNMFIFVFNSCSLAAGTVVMYANTSFLFFHISDERKSASIVSHLFCWFFPPMAKWKNSRVK